MPVSDTKVNGYASPVVGSVKIITDAPLSSPNVTVATPDSGRSDVRYVAS